MPVDNNQERILKALIGQGSGDPSPSMFRPDEVFNRLTRKVVEGISHIPVRKSFTAQLEEDRQIDKLLRLDRRSDSEIRADENAAIAAEQAARAEGFVVVPMRAQDPLKVIQSWKDEDREARWMRRHKVAP